MKRILVFQTWGVGDMIMTTPMLQALKEHFHGAKVTVVAGSLPAASVVSGASWCDDIKILPVRGISWSQTFRFFLEVRRQGYDMAIIATRINRKIPLLCRTVGNIPVVIGDGFDGSGFAYTHWRKTHPDEHRIDANLRMVEDVVAKPGAFPIWFGLTRDVESAAADWRNQERFCNVPMIGLHPGSDGEAGRNKRPPVALCREIIQGIALALPRATIAVVIGPAEQELKGSFGDFGQNVVILDGLPLAVVAARIKFMNVLIAGDSGLGHVATALGTPLIALFGPTNERSTAPRGAKVSIVRGGAELPCAPCYGTAQYHACPRQIECLRSIPAHRIIELVVSYAMGRSNFSTHGGSPATDDD
jgi:heptosyltransferase-2